MPLCTAPGGALSQLLPPRRRRSHPRLTPGQTATRRTARTAFTGTITYKITITAPAQATNLPAP
jgi:hypothetical protein